jgi:hypothetical protein
MSRSKGKFEHLKGARKPEPSLCNLRGLYGSVVMVFVELTYHRDTENTKGEQSCLTKTLIVSDALNLSEIHDK